MSRSLEVIFVSSEVAGFAKTGGLADVSASLPKALNSLGHKVRVFLPLYREVKKKTFPLKLCRKDLSLIINGKTLSFSLYKYRKQGVDFYFISQDKFFDRDYLYSTPKKDYPDNHLRFAFFSGAVLNSLINLKLKPDIIHCNEWQTALIPFHLKNTDIYKDYFRSTKTVFTIHNLVYQGLFPKTVIKEIGIDKSFFKPESLEFYNKFSFIKAGIIYSQAITTVSRGYAKAILTVEFGCGLDGLLRSRKKDLFGILNGADYSQWNPKTDKFIKSNYDKNSLDKKRLCKKDLLLSMGLPADFDKPVLASISRLVYDKGIDIIIATSAEIVKMNCFMIFLAMGRESDNRKLRALARKYPKNIAVKIGFDNGLAHKIEAGADIFLMPSRNEPCGLNQLYSLKYGTIPLVAAVGGLDDTIIDYRKSPKSGNGFKFKPVCGSEFLKSLKAAIGLYHDDKSRLKLIKKAMACDFSWAKSAKEYIRTYKRVIDRR